jgi:hypothetical protein
MAPADSAGVGNLCSHASPACMMLCLGRESGQAAIINKQTGTNSTRDSRERKARYFMGDRQAYMREMMVHIARNARKARRMRKQLAVRPNGSTDIAYEGIRIFIDDAFAAELSRVSGYRVTAGLHTIFSAFPGIQFVDYTKNPHRMRRVLPANYHLTFSRSEINEPVALDILASGKNVAIPFHGTMPETWHGYTVVNGDTHDLRFLDPQGGYVVGLSPKGTKAKRDEMGFVVRH